MWSLKYEYRHKDCLYLPKSDKLNISLYTYPINHYKKNNTLYITAIHIIEGKLESVKKYVNYLKKISMKLQHINDNTVFTLATKEKNLEYYDALYNSFLFYPTPILHQKNKEYGQVMSWDKENLTKVYKTLKNSPFTAHFKVLHFKNIRPKSIFLMKITKNITSKQRTIFEFASQNGYYRYPRKINLDQIAKNFKISKSTCHETLRRAETNILEEKFKR